MRYGLLLIMLVLLPSIALAVTRQVGPTRTYTLPCAAIAAASSGDIIEIDGVDAGGNQLEYVDDFCKWATPNLTIRGVVPSGTPVCNSEQVRTCPHVRRAVRLLIDGQGIWKEERAYEIGSTLTVQNIEMSGAHSHTAVNGQPIWPAYGGSYVYNNIYFHHNDNGILTGNELGVAASARVYDFTITNSELAFNGGLNMDTNTGGQQHNLYIGEIRQGIVEGTWLHDAVNGQDLKSRANIMFARYNRLGDWPANNRIFNNQASPNLVLTGNSNYEMDYSVGGTLYFIGNQVIQACATGNKIMMIVNYETPPVGEESTAQELYMVNNTFVDQCENNQTVFLRTFRAIPTTWKIQNNIWAGAVSGSKIWSHGPNGGEITQAEPADNKKYATVAAATFLDALNQNYHIVTGSDARDAGVVVTNANGQSLVPNKHYTHPLSTTTRSPAGARLDVGAFETNAILGTLIPPPHTWVIGTATGVTVNWTPSLADTDVTQYRVLRDGSALATVTAALTYSDTTAAADTTYSYTVIADTAGGSSIVSNAALGMKTRQVSGALSPSLGWQKLTGTVLDSVIVPSTNNSLVFYNASLTVDTQANRVLIWNNGQTRVDNSIYALDPASLSVSKIQPLNTEPSCTAGEITGTGRPCARQTFGGTAWMGPPQNKMFAYGGFKSGPGFLRDTWTWTPSGDVWALQATTGTSQPATTTFPFSAWDPTGQRMLTWTQDCLRQYNPTTKVYSNVGTCTNLVTRYDGVVDPVHNRLYVFASYFGGFYDLSSGVFTYLTQTSGCGMLMQGGAGLTWDDRQAKIVAWLGGDIIYTVDPATNTCSQQTIAGGPGFPTVASAYLIGRRFQYVPSVNAFIAFTDTNTEAYALRLTAAIPAIRTKLDGTGGLGGRVSIQ